VPDNLVTKVFVSIRGKAGISEPDGQGVTRQAVEGVGGGDGLQLGRVEGEALVNRVADGGCPALQHPVEPLGGPGLGVLVSEILEQYTQQAGCEGADAEILDQFGRERVLRTHRQAVDDGDDRNPSER
jgi:hypothetical protein